jgi:uncharacterized membrane protein
MSWYLRFRVREHLRTALWPIPGALGIAGLLLGMLTWRVDRWVGWRLLEFEHPGAMALTAAIVGASLTFLGTAFSVLLVVVQFASTQLTPRALRVSLSDPLYRVTVGLFVATFTYSLVILSRTDEAFVPQLGVHVAVVLVVLSLGAYVALISQLRSAVRPVIVAARVGRMGLRTLAQIYRETLEARPAAGPAAGSAARREPPRAIPSAGPAGMLLAFDVEGLVAEARRCDAELVLVPAPGDFVRTGSPLFHAFESGTPVDAGRLRASVLLGQERTMHQDPAFALRILVDLAIKALSPTINDPTSAVMAMDQLHELLAYLASRQLDMGRHRDREGRVRLTVEMPSWEDYLGLALDEIRHFGEQHIQVLRRLRALLEDLRQIAPGERRPAVERELALLGEAVRRGFVDAEEQVRAGVPDSQGLGSSPR